MTLPYFPTLAGQQFPIKRPITATIIAGHESGREVRTAAFQGLYEFEIAFDGLTSGSAAYGALGAQSLQSIMGLYLQCSGSLATFLYVDPSDNAAVQTTFATGDGVTTQFKLARSIGGALDIVGYATGLTAVWLNGVSQGSGWSLTAPNYLTFSSAPAAGSIIAASFTYAWTCRFLDDRLDFEEFMSALWEAKSVKFRSVLQ